MVTEIVGKKSTKVGFFYDKYKKSVKKLTEHQFNDY